MLEEELDPQESVSVRAFLHKYRVVLTATATAGAGGLLMLAFGFLLEPHAPIWADAIREAGKVVVVTSIIGLVFEFVMHDRFVHRVLEQVHRLDTSIEHLQRTVAIKSGAIESGLSAVYSDRKQAIDEMETLIGTAETGSELRLVGISLGDFLCPHGRLYGVTGAALARGISVKTLLLDLDSDAARTRAQREESDTQTPHWGTSTEWMTWYHTTRCYNELKTASDVARFDMPKILSSSMSGKAVASGKFECKTYELAPLCFLTILGDTMFLESYHYAGRGGEAPILKIARRTGKEANNSRLFEIYERHFSVLWHVGRPLLPQPLISVVEASRPSANDPMIQTIRTSNSESGIDQPE